MVFRDPQALADLERITHPPVVAEIRRRIALSEADVVVVEAVKLVESGLLADVDSLWLVTADPDVRLRRLAARRGLSEADARDRLGASLHVAELHAPIDVVIDNSGDMSQVARAVADAWRALIPQAESPLLEPVASVNAKENA
jgi:dephospho-CoA kinase